MKHLKDDILLRIIDLYSDEATDADKQWLDDWIEADASNKQAFLNCLTLLNDIALARNAISVASLKSSLAARKPRRRLLVRIGYAAVIVLLIGTGLLIRNANDRNPQAGVTQRIAGDVTLTLPDGREVVLDRSNLNANIAESEELAIVRENGSLVYEPKGAANAGAAVAYGSIVVPRGANIDMALADGTHVWLNADSRLRFPASFSGNERRVVLEGEAYFEVAYNENKPFIVETADQVLKVLGTEFNISAYAEGDNAYTTLVAGSLSLVPKAGTDGVVLRPGEQASLKKGSSNYRVSAVSTKNISSWRDGMFVLDNNTLGMVFAKIARWYDFEYEFENSQTADYVVMGVIPVYEDLDSVLEVIEISGLADIEQNGRHVQIKMKK